MKASMPRRLVLDFLFFSFLFVVAGTVFLQMAHQVYETAENTAADVSVDRPVIVIDAGHGGEDGGASGADGTLEKDLNLQVAKALAQILSAAGYDVRLTRTDDRLLYDMYKDLSDYTGHKKTYDLRNRLRFAKEANAVLLISIHMNKFTEEQYKGLQVYYSPNDDKSRTVAELIQKYTRLYLQPDNERETKRAGNSIYLLSHCEIPAVLVECGFLSNAQELESLHSPVYQKQLALVLAAAVAESVPSISP